mmetsp:Transcript_26622/g.50440  ORF Transcript_26622/g.50440 Transcript_26622/m.50440 type:complete len:253 (-) Transcript_26622:459-1217(-)
MSAVNSSVMKFIPVERGTIPLALTCFITEPVLPKVSFTSAKAAKCLLGLGFACCPESPTAACSTLSFGTSFLLLLPLRFCKSKKTFFSSCTASAYSLVTTHSPPPFSPLTATKLPTSILPGSPFSLAPSLIVEQAAASISYVQSTTATSLLACFSKLQLPLPMAHHTSQTGIRAFDPSSGSAILSLSLLVHDPKGLKTLPPSPSTIPPIALLSARMSCNSLTLQLSIPSVTQMTLIGGSSKELESLPKTDVS